MEPTHPLKTLLQVQLASDSLAVLHLPFILSSLNSEVLQPSPHTQKWSTRISSLIHSKDTGARWAGLCIAQQTSIYSKALMLECAQSWVTVVLPMLSKNEPEVILKAVIRLLRTVFTTAMDIPEFQRQISTPNIPKFSTALVSLIDRREEETILAMDTLMHLVPLYPNLHRALLASMSTMSLRFLNGSTPKPVPEPLLQSASKLYATLHHTGGKVGAANQWRKSLDETLSFGWGAFLKLRTTFKTQGYDHIANQASSSNEDPLISVPLHTDRLRAAVSVLEDLLESSNSRPVPLPVGSVVRFCQALVSCTRDEKKLEGHVDSVTHAMELSVLPKIWTYGCTLLRALSRCARRHLMPHASRLSLLLARQLEQNSNIALRLPFLQVLRTLLTENAIRDPILASRVSRAVLPALTTLLGTQSDAQREENNSVAHGGTSKKGKKRARGYEGDEVFKVAKEIILPTHESGKAVIVSLEIVRLLMSQGSMTPSVHSLTSRVLLAVYMAIPNIPPGIFSSEPALHGTVYLLVQRICVEAAAGTTSTLSKSLGLVISSSLYGPQSSDVMKEFDLQLHPRVPPLIRALPHVEALALFRAEEGQEENNIRHALRIGTVDELRRSVHMQDTILPSQVRTDKQSDAPTIPSVPTIPPTQPMLAQEAPLASSALSQTATPVAATAPVSSFTESARVSIQPPPPPPQAKLARSADVQPSSAPISPPVFADRRQTAAASTSTTPSIPTQTTVPTPRHVQMAIDDDDDEPMPSIDMGSDSDSE